jgi:alpha-mannosidase
MTSKYARTHHPPTRPHTHLTLTTLYSVGWLKTVDQYHYGNRNDIQRAGTQNIINAVIKELAWNPDRKFSYVEQAFFQRFWDEADDKMRDVTRGLVASGQLEFINGGWCMHDEAAPGFADMIDQTTLGHRLILQQFNVTPKVTWQIDPFGHSTFQASMMSAPIAGFSGVHVARDDWQEQNQRTAARTIEMVWAPSRSLGMAGATYMGVLYNGYCTIGGIDMSIGSNDAPIMDDPTLEDLNIGAIVDNVVANAYNDIKQYPQGEPGGDGTADVLLLLGCDFEWENAGTWFTASTQRKNLHQPAPRL